MPGLKLRTKHNPRRDGFGSGSWGIDAVAVQRFLLAVRKHGRGGKAANAAGVAYSAIAQLGCEDPAFARAWDAAIEVFEDEKRKARAAVCERIAAEFEALRKG